uniref:WAP domain-containing protein n=1 Tax=Gopherus agassizii TaxID=38772 RepID=A0A452HDZ8_9SAUR
STLLALPLPVLTLPAASPGVCPKRKVLQPFAPCNNKCDNDRNCTGKQKCCFTGCGLDCVPPQEGTRDGGRHHSCCQHKS